MRYITVANTDLSKVHEAINRRAMEGFKVHTFTVNALSGWWGTTLQFVALLEKMEKAQ